MGKIWLVEGAHWNVPGNPLTAHATRESADRKAAELVNIMCAEIGTPGCRAPDQWAEALAGVHKARWCRAGEDPAAFEAAYDAGDVDTDCWVEVSELDLIP